MKYYILASGSKGNCAIIESSKGTKIVIDLGLTLTAFKEKAGTYNIDISDIDAFLFTHKHRDHLHTLYKTIPLNKVYATRETLPGFSVNHFDKYDTFNIKDFEITALPTSHDAPNPVGFIIRVDNKKLALMTDTGYVSTNNIEQMKNADYYIFESNHNEVMLLQTNRPYDLIQRILGDEGHLSNEAAANYLVELIGDKTKDIVLAHLSQEANTKELALSTVKRILLANDIDASKYNIIAASQFTPLMGGSFEN